MSRAASAAGFLTFGLLGLLQASFGPTIPALRDEFHLSAASAGLVLGMHWTGAVMGSIAATISGRWVSMRWRLVGAGILLAAGSLTVSVADVWLLVLAGAFTIGIGFGLAATGFNLLFASGFGRSSAAMLMLVNAVFGIGSVAGPFLVGLFTQSGYRLVYLAGTGLAALSILLASNVPSLPPANRADGPASGIASTALIAFMALLFLYGGIENSIGGWAATSLRATGLSAAQASDASAFYWATFTIGRLLAAPLLLKAAPQRMVLATLALVPGIMLLSLWHPFSIAAYAAVGLTLAPIFPAVLSWAARYLASQERAMSLIFMAVLLGSGVNPVVIGELISVTGPRALPLAVTAIGLGALSLSLALTQRLERSPLS